MIEKGTPLLQPIAQKADAMDHGKTSVPPVETLPAEIGTASHICGSGPACQLHDAPPVMKDKELAGFLQWAGAIMRDTPIETNNFLAKALESHLLGRKTTFTPERIVRAFEMMERNGQIEGMKLLQQRDPELSVAVERLLHQKRKSSTVLDQPCHPLSVK